MAQRVRGLRGTSELPGRPAVLTISSFSTRWAFFFLVFSFLVRKIPFAGIELTSQRVRGLRGTSVLPGRPVIKKNQNAPRPSEHPPVMGKKCQNV